MIKFRKKNVSQDFKSDIRKALDKVKRTCEFTYNILSDADRSRIAELEGYDYKPRKTETDDVKGSKIQVNLIPGEGVGSEELAQAVKKELNNTNADKITYHVEPDEVFFYIYEVAKNSKKARMNKYTQKMRQMAAFKLPTTQEVEDYISSLTLKDFIATYRTPDALATQYILDFGISPEDDITSEEAHKVLKDVFEKYWQAVDKAFAAIRTNAKETTNFQEWVNDFFTNRPGLHELTEIIQELYNNQVVYDELSNSDKKDIELSVEKNNEVEEYKISPATLFTKVYTDVLSHYGNRLENKTLKEIKDTIKEDANKAIDKEGLNDYVSANERKIIIDKITEYVLQTITTKDDIKQNVVKNTIISARSLLTVDKAAEEWLYSVGKVALQAFVEDASNKKDGYIGSAQEAYETDSKKKLEYAITWYFEENVSPVLESDIDAIVEKVAPQFFEAIPEEPETYRHW